MSTVNRLRIEQLDIGNRPLVKASIALLVDAFEKGERYNEPRLEEELRSGNAIFYRQFFIASKGNAIVGFGGVKAADWASHTHLLYLSAVAQAHRGQGIGRALLKARIEWVEATFKLGRILVSSARARRFQELGFVPVPKSGIEGRHLMMRRF